MMAYDGIANLQKSYTENLKFFFCAKIMYPCPVPPIWLLIFKGGCTLGVCSEFVRSLFGVCSVFARALLVVQLPLSEISKRDFFIHYIPLQRSPSDRSILFHPPPPLWFNFFQQAPGLSVRSLFVVHS